MIPLDNIDPTKAILIAGPTASGKSSLALSLAQKYDGIIFNADALQVYDCWRVLSARPSLDEEKAAPHCLYGTIAKGVVYSVGEWLRDVAAVLDSTDKTPIIVGGTGLYFTALTEGLADIPALPENLRAESDALGPEILRESLQNDDPETFARIDTQNPMRVQRAWEVLRGTGRGMADWQDNTPPPLLPLVPTNSFALEAPVEWLNPRINQRFDQMIALGALDECRAALPDWQPNLPSSRAIGAPELIAHLRGETSLDEAIDAAKIATRQYAKRQRTWFRARMKNWVWIAPS